MSGSLNAQAVVALLPLLALSGGAVLVMLAVAVRRDHDLAFWVAAAALAASLVLLVPASRQAPLRVTALLVVDRASLYYVGLLAAATLAVALLAHGYLARRGGQREEFYILLLTAGLGSAVIASSIHYASFFLGLEILSVSLYGLVAYLREEERGIEGGLKYLILAGVSSAFLLFGIALIYAATGSLGFVPLGASPVDPSGLLALAGVGLFAVGIGFKLAVVPFHLWTPDVFQGAPLPVTALIATVSKGAVLALLLRYAALVDLYRHPAPLLAFSVIAGASMFVGNFLALLQDNLKRLLAYSSIAHMGYILVALLAGGRTAGEAAAFYLAAYFITSLGAFGVLTVLSPGGAEVESFDQVRGLAWRRPWLAAALTLMLLSLAGLPLTAGFEGKIYVLAAGASSRLWTLAVLLVVNSAIGLYYYLRVVLALFGAAPAVAPAAAAAAGAGGPAASAPVPSAAEAGAPPPAPSAEAELSPALSAAPRVPLLGGITLAVLALLLLALGVYPGPLIQLIRGAAI